MIDRFFATGGSTRVVGAMRILAVLVTWSRFGAGMPAFGQSPFDVVLGIVFWVVSTLALLGLYARPAILATGLCVMASHYVQGVMAGNGNLSSHHVYAQGLLCCLLVLTPCGRSFSLDRWRTGLPEMGPVWGQKILVFQTTILYLGAVYEKSDLAWFDGSRMTHFAMQIYVGSDVPDAVWFTGAMAIAAIGTWVIELALAVLIWVPRARVPMLVVGFVFHGLVYVFTPVATFSVTMYVFLLSCLDGDDVDRWVGQMQVPSVVRAPPLGLVLLPLVAFPVAATLGVPLPVPKTEILETLGQNTCQVRIERDGSVLPQPLSARSHGLDGVKRAAWRACRGRGPVDLIGRCGSETGWAEVDLRGWCEEPPPPGPNRRISAR